MFRTNQTISVSLVKTGLKPHHIETIRDKQLTNNPKLFQFQQRLDAGKFVYICIKDNLTDIYGHMGG